MKLANAPLAQYWSACVDKLKDRINNRSFWEALEATTAITIDNGVLVLGLAPENVSRGSAIIQTTTAHVVSAVIKEVFGQPLRVELIEGAGIEDWEAFKEREARVAAIKQQALSRRPATPTSSAASGSWEAVYEQMSRLFTQIPFRALPQGKARYANEALYILLDAMETLYPDPPDDSAERSLARVLERISNASEIPAPMLAFELERLRAWKSAETAE
jgi:hypothetical protein